MYLYYYFRPPKVRWLQSQYRLSKYFCYVPTILIRELGVPLNGTNTLIILNAVYTYLAMMNSVFLFSALHEGDLFTWKQTQPSTAVDRRSRNAKEPYEVLPT